jgi:hypothetical protein
MKKLIILVIISLSIINCAPRICENPELWIGENICVNGIEENNYPLDKTVEFITLTVNAVEKRSNASLDNRLIEINFKPQEFLKCTQPKGCDGLCTLYPTAPGYKIIDLAKRNKVWKTVLVHELLHIILDEKYGDSDGEHLRSEWGNGMEIPVALLMMCHFNEDWCPTYETFINGGVYQY